MENNNKVNQRQDGVTLISKNCGIEPVKIGYDVATSYVESWLKKYIESKGVDVLRVVTEIIKEGGNEGNGSAINVAVAVFFDSASPDVQSAGNRDVPAGLRKKLGGGSFRPSQKLNSALTPLVSFVDGRPATNLNVFEGKNGTGKTILYVKCNIFKILSLMFDCNKQYKIVIAEAMQTKKDGFLGIYKILNTRYDNDNGAGNDIFRNIVRNLNSKR